MAETTPPIAGADTLAPPTIDPSRRHSEDRQGRDGISRSDPRRVDPAVRFHATDDELADLHGVSLRPDGPSAKRSTTIRRASAGHDPEARPLLAEPLRLAQGRGADQRAIRNFVTEIDGLDMHFIHVSSKHEDALPLIVTHGWPGSVIEQLKIIEPLTDPTAHGGTAADAFDIVIPSMPGYGFSGKPTDARLGARTHRQAPGPN